MKHCNSNLSALLLLTTVVLAQPVHALTNALSVTPAMGWNTYNHFARNYNAGVIESMADAMATNGMQAAGYLYVNIDGGWATNRDSNGVIVADPTKFPDGIKPVADYVHALGFKLGIYSDHGTKTCGGAPGSYGYEYLDALTYASWGVDYLKYDNCFLPAGDSTNVDDNKMAQALMLTQRPILFSLCDWSFDSWMPACGNSFRTTGDINDSFASLLSNLNGDSPSAYVAGVGRWNDPDMLEVGNGGMTATGDQSEFSLWCIVAAPLIAGNDLTNMSAQTLEILTNAELIAVDQDVAGEQGILVAGSTQQIWCKPLGTGFTNKAVALFNTGSAATNMTVYWTNLGLRPGAATLRDLWAHADLGTYTNSFTTNVASHQTVVLTVNGLAPSLPALGSNFVSALQPVYAYSQAGSIVPNKSIGGNTLTLNGTTYAEGMGVNAYSGLEYRLGGIAATFHSEIGVDDEVGTNGSVIFEVFADGVEIYNSGIMTGGAPHQTINLNVSGVNRLTLGVNDADDGTNDDHADWAGALVTVASLTPQLPLAPGDLEAAAGNAITLTWTNALSALSYNVKRATASSGTFTTLANVPVTQFTDTNVEAGTTYYYAVSSVNVTGEGSNSPEVGVTACSVPAVPANVAATATNTLVLVQWSAAAGAVSYNVERFTSGTPPVLVASGVTETNFIDTGANDETTNYYLVAAVNACNASDNSAFAAALPGFVVLPTYPPPSITTPPASQTLALGKNASFDVTAAGGTPLYYQWRFDGTNLAGATATNLLLTDLARSNGGSYTVVVSNQWGSVTSQTALLTVGVPPSITAQPATVVVLPGGNASFNVGAAGDATLSYQWRLDGTNLTGTTASNILLTNIALSNAGSYIAVVTNLIGRATSAPALLIVQVSPPVIVTPPVGGAVLVGSNVVFNVAVSGPGPFTYQWQFNGVNLSNYIMTVAGDGSDGSSGDGGAATNAALYAADVAVDGKGDIFIADSVNDRVRQVTANGTIMTAAGDGAAGDTGNGGPATNASLFNPSAVAVDSLGNLYIADSANECVRKVGTNGLITLVAGNGSNGFAGDNGPAVNASLSFPDGVVMSAAGSLYIADDDNNRIRQVGTNGVITTVAGNGSNGFAGDNGPATNASLSNPGGLALDAAGNLYIADSGNKRVRKVGTNGVINTVAGTGAAGFYGDGGPATNAFMESPAGVAVDPLGNLLIADSENHRIRIVGTNGLINTLAGDGTYGFAGDGGSPASAELSDVYGVATDASGDVFIADTGNNRVREVVNYQEPTLALFNLSAADSGGYDVVILSPYGVTTSAVVNLTVAGPPLGATRAGNTLIFTWPAGWELQTAASLTGPWTNLPSASSPYTNPIGTQAAAYFRLR